MRHTNDRGDILSMQQTPVGVEVNRGVPVETGQRRARHSVATT